MSKKPTSCLIIVALLSGCAHLDDTKLTYLQGGAIGAVAGALVGGLASNGKSFNGSAVGALIGGSAGILYADHVARRKAKFKAEEEWLDACIEQARLTIKSAERFNAKLTKEINYLNGLPSESSKLALSEARKYQRDIGERLPIINQEIANQRYAKAHATPALQVRLNEPLGTLLILSSKLTQKRKELAAIVIRFNSGATEEGFQVEPRIKISPESNRQDAVPDPRKVLRPNAI